MTVDELEAARNRHQFKVAQHQYIVKQIVEEQKRRASLSAEASALSKCPECKQLPRAFMILPCRHLGRCAQCDALNDNETGKCPVCCGHIQQKIAINFAE